MRALATSAPRGHTIELPGVEASVMPSAPERSVINCVVYADAERLAQSLDTLADGYARAGVRAWTVWVPLGEPAATEALAAAGHVLDGSPRAMVLDLSAFERSPDPSLELAERPSFVEVGRLNDQAYGLPGDFERALAGASTDAFHVYLALADGEPACSVVTYDVDGDCGVYVVATAPAAQGRGLASAVMTRALVDARERGCATSSLQATARGRGVYERLGYKDLGAIEMWERRQTS
jgi:ribosomal protein S18 acetylase RimI-like enzyme